MNRTKQLKGKVSQAALEFLMTYGWAVLVVLIVIGAVSYFGILSPESFMPYTCSLEAGLSCDDVSIEQDDVTMVVTNNLGRDIHITSIEYPFDAYSETTDQSCFFLGDVVIHPGSSATISTSQSCIIYTKNIKRTIYPKIEYYFSGSTSNFEKTNEGKIIAK